MMAPEYYIFTGGVVPLHVTHVLIDKDLKFVRKRAFYNHPNIEEVICHDGVEKIEEYAFHNCPRLRRAIMPGVKEVVLHAFNRCEALTYIECSKLETIGDLAFQLCVSLSSIEMPSIRCAGVMAFLHCKNLMNAKFGKDLESIGAGAFLNCTSLERIALPLKDDLLTYDNIFRNCDKLNHVDLIGGVHETVAALLLEKWKNDMNEEIDSINQNLASARAGICTLYDVGGMAREIRVWIRSVLRKLVHYKAEHRRYLNVKAALEPALPKDIVLNNVLPFLSKSFGRERLNACTNLISVNFGKDLASIGDRTFCACGRSLECIAIPLKDGIIADDRIFQGCITLNCIDLVEGEILDEIVADLLIEEWKDDMSSEIDSINRILATTSASNAGMREKARRTDMD